MKNYLQFPIRVNVLGWLISHAVVFAAGALTMSVGWDVGLIVILAVLAYWLVAAVVRGVE